MKMLFFLVINILLSISKVYSSECRTVKQGEHFTSTFPFYGFKQDLVISTRIQFDKSATRYLFPPEEIKGRMCSQSWNQLWGATRCGYLTSNHMDADRFVWRRAGSCLEYDSTGHVTGEQKKCAEKNFIELAASTYDNGRKPFEHPGTLLKEFSTKLKTNKWYGLKIIVEETKTIYELSNQRNKLLESQTIDHRSCPKFNLGMMQGLYFGGQCPAPQDITVCYE